MGEVVWTVMAGVSAAALLYGAWLVLADLVLKWRGDPSAKAGERPRPGSSAARISLSKAADVLPERRSGVDRRSSQRQAQRIAA